MQEDAELILKQVLIKSRRWRRGDVFIFSDRIVTTTQEESRKLKIEGLKRIARSKKVFTGLRLTIDGDDGRLEIRGLTSANAARAQSIISRIARATQE